MGGRVRSPAIRNTAPVTSEGRSFEQFGQICIGTHRGLSTTLYVASTGGSAATSSRVMQAAKPRTPVRIRAPPPRYSPLACTFMEGRRVCGVFWRLALFGDIWDFWSYFPSGEAARIP